MIIFFGTRYVYRDYDQPVNIDYRFCPRCNQQTQFRPRVWQQYLHVFWVPLIPLDDRQPVVECQRCRTRYVVHQ